MTTTPSPGWLPDPTGRHEYRYWDGGQWCDDVSDGGNTSFDPISATPQPPQDTGYGAGQQPVGGHGSYGQEPAPSHGGYGQPTDPYAGSQHAPAPAPQSSGSGPSTGLLVGLGVLLAVLVVGIAVILTSSGGDDDDGGDTDTAGNTDTAGDGDSDGDGGDGGGDGDGDGSEAITEVIAAGIVSSADGVITDEEGQCIAEGMVGELGIDRIIELGLNESNGGNPFNVLEADEQTAVLQAILDCVPVETLVEIGADPG